MDISRDRTVAYRCMDCSIEFTAGPGPTTCPACGGLYVGRLSWYVVATNPKADAVVADRLRALGHLVLHLHYVVTIRPQNRARTIKRSLLPNYVFAGVVPVPDFYAIATLPGVSMLLANESGRPYQLDQSEIDRLRAGADKDGRVMLEEPGAVKRRALEVGSVVRIMAGPFQGFEGEVSRDDGKRLLAVRASLFGRETEVELPWQAVEAA